MDETWANKELDEEEHYFERVCMMMQRGNVVVVSEKRKIKSSKIVNNERYCSIEWWKKLLFFVILTISTATLFDKAINYWCCISSLTRCLSTQHQFFLCLTHKQNIFPLSAYIKFFLFSLLPQWKASLKSMWRFNNFWHFLTTTTTAIVSWTLRVWAFTLYLHGCYEILGYVFFFHRKAATRKWVWKNFFHYSRSSLSPSLSLCCQARRNVGVEYISGDLSNIKMFCVRYQLLLPSTHVINVK